MLPGSVGGKAEGSQGWTCVSGFPRLGGASPGPEGHLAASRGLEHRLLEAGVAVSGWLCLWVPLCLCLTVCVLHVSSVFLCSCLFI